MSKTKNKYSVCKVERERKNGKKVVVGYLSNRDIEQGLDVSLDMQGYEITSID